jgi:hypothetical protein
LLRPIAHANHAQLDQHQMPLEDHAPQQHATHGLVGNPMDNADLIRVQVPEIEILNPV